MQVATAFGRVQDSLSYFVDVYASLAEWQAVVDRLTGFEEDMARVQAAGSQSHVERLESADGTSGWSHWKWICLTAGPS